MSILRGLRLNRVYAEKPKPQRVGERAFSVPSRQITFCCSGGLFIAL
jgi:hypothetical protein